MTESSHSLTAEGVAIARAVHQFLDDEPLILRDPLAIRIIGGRTEQWVRSNLGQYGLERMRRMRGMVTIRSRLCEDELAAAIDAGTVQYVVLGAGLDTFAYRSPEVAGRVTVFEVDQPGTQSWKLAKLREAGIGVPENVRYVPVDFNKRALADALADAGFDRTAPAFFAWLGVSYYLPRESIVETLRFVAGQTAPSQVVFDFAVDSPGIPPEFEHLFAELRAYMRTSAEPWRTWFVPDDLIAELRSLGFDHILHLDYREAQRRWLAGRTDGLLPGPLIGLISARVTP